MKIGAGIQNLLGMLTGAQSGGAAQPAGGNANPLLNLFSGDTFTGSTQSASTMPNLSGGGGGGLTLPPKPTNPGANASDQDMLKYQEDMQRYNRMLTMITQLQQMDHEGKKAVIQNLRA
jgi:hypothetical protein